MRRSLGSREALVVVVMVTAALASEVHQQYHYKVRRHSSVSIVNPYGLISVKPSGNHVVVNAILYSDKVGVGTEPGRQSRLRHFSFIARRRQYQRPG